MILGHYGNAASIRRQIPDANRPVTLTRVPEQRHGSFEVDVFVGHDVACDLLGCSRHDGPLSSR